MELSQKYINRFWSKVDKSGDCWLWTSSTNAQGYGQFGVVHAGRRLGLRSHRVAYELEVGPIPDGMLIDHVCFMRACCNPKHLRLATQKQNMENRPGPNSNSSSGVRGVYFDARHNRWQGRVEHNGRKLNVGSFASKDEAESATVAMRNDLFTHNERDRQAA